MTKFEKRIEKRMECIKGTEKANADFENSKKDLKLAIDLADDVIVMATDHGVALIGTTLDICGATCGLLDKIREEFGEAVFESIIETVQKCKFEELEKKDDDLDKLNGALDKLKDLMNKMKGE